MYMYIYSFDTHEQLQIHYDAHICYDQELWYDLSKSYILPISCDYYNIYPVLWDMLFQGYFLIFLSFMLYSAILMSGDCLQKCTDHLIMLMFMQWAPP